MGHPKGLPSKQVVRGGLDPALAYNIPALQAIYGAISVWLTHLMLRVTRFRMFRQHK